MDGCIICIIITGNDLSVIALIGIILLIGIVMKNAIMMIDFALEQERLYTKIARDAIYEAALLRFRPILMTTMASYLVLYHLHLVVAWVRNYVDH